MAQQSILVVDDDDILRTRLEKAFAKRGLTVYCASNLRAAIEIASEHKPDLAVLDLKMPDNSGLQVLKELIAICPDLRAVILTGYGSIANAVEAVKLGAVNYVTKPADADQVLAAFEKVDVAATEEAEVSDLQPPSLAAAQWEHIHRVLADCGGNISEAARRLDIPRRTLQRKLKKMAP
ncbi:MAG: response regulator transcription factor [Planctomycetota bacterium]|jgi:two-component system response regulator RegA